MDSCRCSGRGTTHVIHLNSFIKRGKLKQGLIFMNCLIFCNAIAMRQRLLNVCSLKDFNKTTFLVSLDLFTHDLLFCMKLVLKTSKF